MLGRLRQASLTVRIVLSASLLITLLLFATAALVQRRVVDSATQGLQGEVKASLKAYESVWQARAEMLGTVSQVLSSMSDVRAAFGTGDEATIRDTAGEIWSRISRQDALFLVTDPGGRVLASLSGHPGLEAPRHLSEIAAIADRFPAQAQGFLELSGRLYQVVVTPVYVQANGGSDLLNVLVAGYQVDEALVRSLEERTPGTSYVFFAGEQTVGVTLSSVSLQNQVRSAAASAGLQQIALGDEEYALIKTELRGLRGEPLGELAALRSYASVRERVSALRGDIALIWLLAIGGGVFVAFLLARGIVRPLRRLDQAVRQVAERDYAAEVPVAGRDEIGQLATTFNEMCVSIRKAREELVLREQMSTIGRLSGSIMHDLRNPLAAIYGGTELLLDHEMQPEQVRRLASNMHRAAVQVQDLIKDLMEVARGQSVTQTRLEPCSLQRLVQSACGQVATRAQAQGVAFKLDVDDSIGVVADRRRMERVFINLFQNALDVMPQGGQLRVLASRDKDTVLVQVEDTGPGLPEAMQAKLFQPFASDGKKSGIGLGLALARQTLLDHGGDLWAVSKPGQGARFCIRLRADATVPVAAVA